MKTPTIQIPESIRIEHSEIHSLLVEATQFQGQIGDTARKLAEILHPHFVREEEIALPPLGFLAPLVEGYDPNESETAELLTMTDALKKELSLMLEEHKAIRSAVEELRKAASAEKNEKFVKLADDLALHAQSEEEVFYPAAVLVGEVVRDRGKKQNRMI